MMQNCYLSTADHGHCASAAARAAGHPAQVCRAAAAFRTAAPSAAAACINTAAAATARFISAGFAAMCAFCIFLVTAPHCHVMCCSDEYGAALQRKALSILHTVLEVLQASAVLPLYLWSGWWGADEAGGGAARRPSAHHSGAPAGTLHFVHLVTSAGGSWSTAAASLPQLLRAPPCCSSSLFLHPPSVPADPQELASGATLPAVKQLFTATMPDWLAEFARLLSQPLSAEVGACRALHGRSPSCHCKQPEGRAC